MGRMSVGRSSAPEKTSETEAAISRERNTRNAATPEPATERAPAVPGPSPEAFAAGLAGLAASLGRQYPGRRFTFRPGPLSDPALADTTGRREAVGQVAAPDDLDAVGA